MTPKIWWGADFHLGHGGKDGKSGVLTMCKRPFADIEEHNAALIANWNADVGEEDTVFDLGNFCFGNWKRFAYFVSQLNGKIKLVPAIEHDWMYLRDFKEVRSKTGQVVELMQRIEVIFVPHPFKIAPTLAIVMSHTAQLTWYCSHYGSWHLYGHSHGRLHHPSDFAIDVGVDTNKYHLYSLSTLAKLVKARLE